MGNCSKYSGYQSGSTHDHGNLTGLADDDHPQYVRSDADDTVEGKLTIKDHITLEDDGTVWDDLRFPAVDQSRRNAPTETTYKGGLVLALASNTDQGIYFTVQLPHAWKEGSDIEMHMHFVIPTAGAGGGAENIKMDLTYSWANIDGSFPAESSATITLDVQNLAADTHTILDISTLTGTGKTMSSIILCSLTRDTSVANDYADDVYLLEADIHYEMDALGSDSEYIKVGSPPAAQAVYEQDGTTAVTEQDGTPVTEQGA